MKKDRTIAWVFELAQTFDRETSKYSNWSDPQLSFGKPCVPEGAIRNLRPLIYDAVTAEDGIGEWDIEATAEMIARNLSAIEGGRFHAVTYAATKAGALEAFKTAKEHLKMQAGGADE